MNNLSEIQHIGNYKGNQLYIKREDLIPVSFGGNKARKSLYFLNYIKQNYFDAVVTYGSSSSNHCRVTANMCAANNIKCIIVSPIEKYHETNNSQMIHMMGAEIITSELNHIHETMLSAMDRLRNEGYNPFMIEGGGHGDLGTQAYVDCYEEIYRFHDSFDYIFFASGTGTTQAGLVIGKLIHRGKEKIIGISIARPSERGRKVVLDSIHEYLIHNDMSFFENEIEEDTIFIDKYISGGYGENDKSIDEVIRYALINWGIPFDSTYTAKAFNGMTEFIMSNHIENKKILFIHTGSTPLFFDDLRRMTD